MGKIYGNKVGAFGVRQSYGKYLSGDKWGNVERKRSVKTHFFRNDQLIASYKINFTTI